MDSLQERAFAALNRRPKMKLPEKIKLLSKFLDADLNLLSKTAALDQLKEMQRLIKLTNKRDWDQQYTANKLSRVYSSYKEHKDAPGMMTRTHRRPESGGLTFFVGMESQLDQLIVEFQSEREVTEMKSQRKMEKATKRIGNASARPQDDVDWNTDIQEAEPCP